MFIPRRVPPMALPTIGTYHIAELDATLSIHTGVGAGRVSGFRVGLRDRWEIFLAGEPLKQVARTLPFRSSPERLPKHLTSQTRHSAPPTPIELTCE